MNNIVYCLVQKHGTNTRIVGDNAYLDPDNAKHARNVFNSTSRLDMDREKLRSKGYQFGCDVEIYNEAIENIYAKASVKTLCIVDDNKVAFVSGHRDLTEEEFDEHYKRQLQHAAWSGHHFVVGDYHGADIMVQRYLHDVLGVDKSRVTVYHMGDKPMQIVPEYEGSTTGGFKTDTERDAAMTWNSDYDIAWIRTGKYDSSTAQNVIRRHATYGTENV